MQVAQNSTFSTGEQPPHIIVAGPDLFALVSGHEPAVDVSFRTPRGRVRPDRFAAEVIAGTLRHLRTGANPQAVTEVLAEELDDALRGQSPDLSPTERPSVSVAVFAPERQLLWTVGSVQAAWLNSKGKLGFTAKPVVEYPHVSFKEVAGHAIDGGTVLTSQISMVDLMGVRRLVLASKEYPLMAPYGELGLAAAEAYLAQLAAEPDVLLPASAGRAWLELIPA